MTANDDQAEVLVSLRAAARRLGMDRLALLRRLEAAPTVRFGTLEAGLRSSRLVAIRRVAAEGTPPASRGTA